MGVFDGLRIPYDRTTDGEDPEPGPAYYSGNYNDENSNTLYLYPWGRKERNPFFIGPYLEEQQMSVYKKHEKDERQNLLKIKEQMNDLHARMGGRDERPERMALMQCMEIIDKEIARSTQEWLNR
jgi:hypothetical protein